MGEWSKKVGEHGEKVVKEFFDLIGWSSSQEGIEMPCARANHERKTHGIDRLFLYKSPLEDGALNNIVTSVKYTSDDYPPRPNSLFKSHFFDLAKTLECFKSSETRRDAIKNFTGVDSTKNIGVLFWLSNPKEQDRDILSEVANCKGLDEFAYETIYVVDNKRISFIYDSIKGIRAAFPDRPVEFFYPSTGKNYNPVTKSPSGLVLPVEYINSSVLLFKVVESDSQSKILVISSIDKFTGSNLKRLIGLAHEISQDWNSSTLILFPDYDSLHHKNEVNDAKSGFANQSFVNSVKVASFNADFRSMANE